MGRKEDRTHNLLITVPAAIFSLRISVWEGDHKYFPGTPIQSPTDLVEHEYEMNIFEYLVGAYRLEEGKRVVDTVNLGVFLQVLQDSRSAKKSM